MTTASRSHSVHTNNCLGERINELIENNRLCDAERFILTNLRRYPTDHWLMARLGCVYSLLGKCSLAISTLQTANKISPQCPLVLWELADALLEGGEPDKAIDVFIRLLRTDINKLSYGKCGEGLRAAKSIKIDSMYGLAASYTLLRNKRKACIWYAKHISNRQRGVFSMYSKYNIIYEYNRLLAGEWPEDARYVRKKALIVLQKSRKRSSVT